MATKPAAKRNAKKAPAKRVASKSSARAKTTGSSGSAKTVSTKRAKSTTSEPAAKKGTLKKVARKAHIAAGRANEIADKVVTAAAIVKQGAQLVDSLAVRAKDRPTAKKPRQKG